MKKNPVTIDPNMKNGYIPAPYVLEEGENGYGDPSAEEFLHAIDAMMADQSWRDAAARRSEEIAAAFDKKAFGETIETVYESVL